MSAVPKKMPDLLAVATEAAYVAGRRTLAHFNAGVAWEAKADASPVTVADREAEQVIRDLVLRHFPTHSVLGEEGGIHDGDPAYRWIIDPIDGTKSFICGVPLYGVLIGVEVNGNVDVGVVYLPALDEMVTAATGLGCTWNGRPARVSGTSRIEDAVLCVTNPLHATARSDAWETLAKRARIQRGWGDCYGHVLVATGRADVMLDPAMNPWDCAPLLPILREAGGHFTDWRGEPTIWGKDAVSTNAALHREVLDVLRDERRRH
ncbi:MAG TPA: histidinol-phosphatase [Tepidisphaeraceae bacterium]|nr:histidinol-phosphatase [Tepidisphaeraceae bacterium]